MIDEMSAELSAELVEVLWETLAELYGSASVYPCDDIRRLAHDIVFLRAELAAALERMSKLDFERTAAELERDALRVLLELSRPYVGQADGLLADQIAAALGGQGDA